MAHGQGKMRAHTGSANGVALMVVKEYNGGGPLNVPFYVSVVNGRQCDHLYLTRAKADACVVTRENHRAPMIPITRGRSHTSLATCWSVAGALAETA